jgi:hypothetical protein
MSLREPIVFLQHLAQFLVRESNRRVSVDTSHRVGRYHRVHDCFFSRAHGGEENGIEAVVGQHFEVVNPLGTCHPGISS